MLDYSLVINLGKYNSLLSLFTNVGALKLQYNFISLYGTCKNPAQCHKPVVPNLGYA